MVGKDRVDEIIVYNLLGQKVFSAKDELLPFVLNMTYGDNSVYLIQVRTRNEQLTEKLIISK